MEPMAVDRFNEFELIARFFAPLAAGEPGALGLLDDAATIAVESGHRMVVTTDTVISGVHFLPSDPPNAVAAKALGVNLSDLAAMGAIPQAYTLSLALPKAWGRGESEWWLEGFVRRLAQVQREAGVHLIGGDTVASPGPLSVTVTALGMVREGMELRRSTACPGDLVYVSGTIGDAALGLKWIAGELPNLSSECGAMLIDRYQFPQARNELGRKLVGIARSAADVSDGLVADIGHICQASGVSAIIEASRVPLSSATQTAVAADPDLLALALTGGDDYELVFTASPVSTGKIRAIARTLDVSLTEIGRIDPPNPRSPDAYVRVLGSDGCPRDLGTTGYQHF